MGTPSTIGEINKLSANEKREIYSRVIPPELIQLHNIPENFIDTEGRDLLVIDSPPGSSDTELSLYHEWGFPDPVLYGHVTDTLNGQIHILLYVLNDPHSPRFDIDVLPDGEITQFGAERRNVSAELDAMKFGLAPGQIRKGPHLLKVAMDTFEKFVTSLGHDIYFVEPLFYHNAINFERNGFTYLKGRRMMDRIATGFSDGGDLMSSLDGSNPFRSKEAHKSIRLRSWAIHDGILGESYTDVTMYKVIGRHAGISTNTGCNW